MITIMIILVILATILFFTIKSKLTKILFLVFIVLAGGVFFKTRYVNEKGEQSQQFLKNQIESVGNTSASRYLDAMQFSGEEKNEEGKNKESKKENIEQNNKKSDTEDEVLVSKNDNNQQTTNIKENKKTNTTSKKENTNTSKLDNKKENNKKEDSKPNNKIEDNKTDNNKPSEKEDSYTPGLKSKYLQKLSSIQSQVDNIDYGDTTYEMKYASSQVLKLWDDALNEIYGVLKSELSSSEMNSLRQKQRAWISYRDKAADKEAAEYEGGTMEGLMRSEVLGSLTRDRCYELVNQYLK